MNHIPFRALMFCLLASLTGCAAAIDSGETDTGVNTVLINADVVTLHPIGLNGAMPPDGALQDAADQIRPFLAGKLVIDPTAVKTMPLPIPELPIIRSSNFKPSLADITLIYIPDSPKIGRGLFSRFDDQHQQIVFNAKGIHAMTSLLISERQAWTLVMTHEMGHALGVPASASHTWHDGHCTDPRCVMYPQMDARSIFTSILFLGPPKGFCDQCRAELEAAKKRPGAE